MKRPGSVETTNPPPPAIASIDRATLELLAAWKAEDATSDPLKIRAAEEEVDRFMKAMNENRAATGERPLYP